MTALTELKEMVEAGVFPADTSARDLGLADVVERTGVPIIKQMYAAHSGSLDAAKALHEALLPGWGMHIDHKYGDGIPKEFEYLSVFVSEPGNWRRVREHKMPVDGDPARAWLIAILKALIAKEEGARKKAGEAANWLTLAEEALQDAGLETLADIARGTLDRLEAVLEGDSPHPGDFE